jgi:hypothetical protein
MPDAGARHADFVLGFRVKSGFAVTVVLSGTAAAPRPIARKIVLLSDPQIEETKQPYHDGFGTAQEDQREIARLTKIIRRAAGRSVADLLADRAIAGRCCRGAGLIVGSLIDPATVGNPHIRAHANEGRLFRTVLEDALGRHGIVCALTVEKSLPAQAPKVLGRPLAQIKKVVGALGEGLDGPWRAEEKTAATAAWMILSLKP